LTHLSSYSIRVNLIVGTGDEKVTAVSTIQQEVAADVKKSLEMNTEVINSMQNQVENQQS